MAGFDIQGRMQRMGLAGPDQQWLPPEQPGDAAKPTTYGERMLFGSDKYSVRMPGCHRQDIVLLHSERYIRDDAAMTPWATEGKRCIDFVENRQMSEQEIRDAIADDRPHYCWNKIAPLTRLILGYHRNNRVQNRFLPTSDVNSVQDMSERLTKIVKHIDKSNQEEYVDTEVFADGIYTGRGYFDYRLNFETNDFGDLKGASRDPFTIRVDADADTYDPATWGHVSESRWWNIDEVEYTFGQNAAHLISPLLFNGSYRGGYSGAIFELQEEITPWRTFGGGMSNNTWGLGAAGMMEAFLANSIDPYRKNIRVVDFQHYIRVMQRNIVNLETGDRTPIPGQFKPEQIQKMMQWCAEQYAIKGEACPLRVEWRPTRRVRWTTLVGDIVVHDDWSPYKTFTLTPFFPYFRRGQTRGVVSDLLDPQCGINRSRNAEIDHVERTAHSGWMWHEQGLREEEKRKIERHGAASGINIEYKGTQEQKPEKIVPGTPPTALQHISEQNALDLKEISGINDSALGQLDRVQSGRAIEARQKQSVLGIEPYMDNWKRTKSLAGIKKLEIIQDHYTEPRLFNIMGENGKWESEQINKRLASGEIANNVTLGRYLVAIDETPLSATFLNAQYEEMVEMAEKGLIPVPIIQDIAIDLSSLPQKELLKQRMNAYLKAQGFLTADELTAMQAAGQVVPLQMIPPPGPHGAPGGGAAPADANGKPGAEGGTQGGQNSGGAIKPPGANPSAGAMAAPATMTG